MRYSMRCQARRALRAQVGPRYGEAVPWYKRQIPDAFVASTSYLRTCAMPTHDNAAAC